MKQRFTWSIGFAMVVMTFLIPFNYFLATTFTTPAQKVQAGFITLIIVEAQIVFLTSFVIVSEYFTLHQPNLNKVIEVHKEDHPEIPETYYEDPKTRAEQIKTSSIVDKDSILQKVTNVENIIENAEKTIDKIDPKPRGKKGVKK